jgi:hypothetical protein
MRKLMLLTAAAVIAAAAGTEAVEPSVSATRSHNGSYVVTATRHERDTWMLMVRTADGALVPHARIVAQAWMPMEERKLDAQLRGQAVRAGQYRLSNMKLDHAGWWNVGLVIAGEPGTDSVAFNVTIK